MLYSHVDLNDLLIEIGLCGKKNKRTKKKGIYFLSINRSKDGVVLSVNQEISGDKKKYEIIGKYDLIIKTIAGNDSGRYLCQNFDQALSMTIVLTVLSK
jgi:hypothetical protein